MYPLVNTADCGMWIQPRLGFEAALPESGLPLAFSAADGHRRAHDTPNVGTPLSITKGLVSLNSK